MRTKPYRGIYGAYEWDKLKNRYYGRAEPRRGTELHFSGQTHEDIESNFRAAINQYLAGEAKLRASRQSPESDE